MSLTAEHHRVADSNGKSAAAYRTISEVSEELDVPQHVLRFWETRFSQVRPLKRGGGRRYYRPEDVKLLRRIQKLLYEEGYTIKGVQKPAARRPVGARCRGSIADVGHLAVSDRHADGSGHGLPAARGNGRTRTSVSRRSGR